MERPTIEITLPLSGAKVILYTYLTMREARLVKKATFDSVHAKVDINQENPALSKTDLKEFALGFRYEAEELAYRSLVKSVIVDGKELADPLSYLETVPQSDGEVLFNEIEKITRPQNNPSGMTDDAKKN